MPASKSPDHIYLYYVGHMCIQPPPTSTTTTGNAHNPLRGKSSDPLEGDRQRETNLCLDKMTLKRTRADEDCSASPPPKRPRTVVHKTTLVARTGPDRLSPLSDELLMRVLSYLSLPHLLAVAPVSRRFHHLSEDSQLWKALYYARFVLPRAMRIPGFRDGAKLDPRIRNHRLHYKGRSTLWADGRMGGLVRDEVQRDHRGMPILRPYLNDDDDDNDDDQDGSDRRHQRVNWKRQYKIRYNWARGKCAVEELKLDPHPNEVVLQQQHDDVNAGEEDDGQLDKSKMLVKVVEGLAVTADKACGLRAWDLKTREVMAQARLQDDRQEGEDTPPSCLAIDDRHSGKGTLEVAVGFSNGSFGVWKLVIQDKILQRLYRHEPSSNGELMGMAYSHPYLLTATGSVLISLYTFDVPEIPDPSSERPHNAKDERTRQESKAQPSGHSLPAPYLMTSLKSNSSDPPLALSIRRTAGITIASIAYTFFMRQGCSIGIQDLHITAHENPKCCPNITTRLAYTTPFDTGTRPIPPPPRSASSSLSLRRGANNRHPVPSSSLKSSSHPTASPSSSSSSQHRRITTIGAHINNNASALPLANHRAPTSLCYTHPYLLATLPDNTLLLHLCTSTSSTLKISPGIRLWGHTSGISDAEITARGKAVSVSSRGQEMRVWELEGRTTTSGWRSRSVEVRPGAGARGDGGAVDHWEERRNWVGFDDEMVIVLKEDKGGRESLLVYDFT